jgi:hypothetical protein
MRSNTNSKYTHLKLLGKAAIGYPVEAIRGEAERAVNSC